MQGQTAPRKPHLQCSTAQGVIELGDQMILRSTVSRTRERHLVLFISQKHLIRGLHFREDTEVCLASQEVGLVR